ncbi:MAG: nicotinate (nicotinamide) nucleotide adenylyltransferase [Helicobacteraceae bacterium]|nr:nicotinate (nicotinamide) nucleotide adenylyltransferase [Candidatus Sulfurimonas ponti]
METIALFGGSFDPPHIAHEMIVQEALKLEDVDKVIVMPTFLNPFKSSFHAPAALRLSWLKSIFASQKNVEISSYEVDKKRKVSSIESVKHLLKRYKKIYLIIGADNLKSLHKWENYNELKTLVQFVVASRDTIDVPNTFLQIKVNEDISSTELRNKMDVSRLSPVVSDEIEKFYTK